MEVTYLGPKMVQITESEYESLKEDSRWLQALESAGVDNWSGIDFAHEILRDIEEELGINED